MMPGREYQAQPSRFGFNGKENDNEVKGFGNQQDYGMRVYDTRLGRFLSVDPINRQYPELTPFQYASNNPILNVDLDGLEGLASMARYLKFREAALRQERADQNATAKNQSAGLNLGFLKMNKLDYQYTSWWIPTSKIGTFEKNSAISGWNQALGAVETSSKLFSNSGRNEIKKNTAIGMFNLLYWWAWSSDGEKIDYVSDKITDVNSYEDLTGSIMLTSGTNSALSWSTNNFVKQLAGLTTRAESIINERAYNIIQKHLQQFGEHIENEIMLQRFQKIIKGDLKATEIDINFAKHELREVELRAKGYSHDEAHEMVLKEQGMYHQGYDKKLYTKEALEASEKVDRARAEKRN